MIKNILKKVLLLWKISALVFLILICYYLHADYKIFYTGFMYGFLSCIIIELLIIFIVILRIAVSQSKNSKIKLNFGKFYCLSN